MQDNLGVNTTSSSVSDDASTALSALSAPQNALRELLAQQIAQSVRQRDVDLRTISLAGDALNVG